MRDKNIFGEEGILKNKKRKLKINPFNTNYEQAIEPPFKSKYNLREKRNKTACYVDKIDSNEGDSLGNNSDYE